MLDSARPHSKVAVFRLLSLLPVLLGQPHPAVSEPTADHPVRIAQAEADESNGVSMVENRENDTDRSDADLNTGKQDTVSGAPQKTPPSLLGSRLEVAKRTEFVNFFNLREEIVTFRPGGDFRDLVKVAAYLDDRGRIRHLEMRLARSFIDDRKSAVFAGDFAKSFLRAAVPPPDREAIEALVADIEQRHPRDMGFSVIRLQPDSAPILPDHPSPGYLVYTGEQQIHEQTFPNCTLRLENLPADGGDTLLVSLRLEGNWRPDGEGASEYQGSGLFEPAEALETVRQAHWAALFDSEDKWYGALRPRLCFLLLRALKEPENEDLPLQTARMRNPIELKLVAKVARIQLEDEEKTPLTEKLSAEEYMDLWITAAMASH